MNKDAINFIVEYMTNNDMSLLNEVENELYNSEYLVIGYSVVNAGVIFESAIFINDLEDEHYSDQSNIFLVSEVSDAHDEIRELLDV